MAKWSIPMSTVTAKMKTQAEVATKQVTYQVLKAVVVRSPVGNPSLWQSPAPPGYVGGRFRANWNVSQGSPNVAVTKSTSGSRADSEVRKALSFKPGGIVYLTNALPYARDLEYGYSTQAPSGMVRLAVAAIKAGFK